MSDLILKAILILLAFGGAMGVLALVLGFAILTLEESDFGRWLLCKITRGKYL